MQAGRIGRSVARSLLAGVLVVGVAACGDDDDDGAVDAPVAEGDGEQAAGDGADGFCTAVVDFNAAVSDAEVGAESSEEEIAAASEVLTPLWDDLTASAPDEVAEEVEVLDPIVDGLADGDAAAFDEEATFETYSKLLSDGLPTCDFETSSITAVDYAFQGVPATVAAGTVVFELANESEEEGHEMVIFRKDDPEADIVELLDLPEEEAQEQVTFAGATFAPPGGSASAILDLAEPGAYAMVCFVPVGGGEEGPPHFTEGMVAEFTVE